MNKHKKQLKKYFPLCLKDWCIFFITMVLASVLCVALRGVSQTDVHVPLIFVLAALIISLATDGYFYGTLAALSSVIGVNWAFTYPYFKLDFSIYGYPLTFMTMLAVGFAVSTLTSRVKEQERIKLESEREKMRANLLRAISHDLRTPLTSISGSISAVLENGGGLDKKQCADLLLDAKKDADWLCRMVENLLSITRISGGNVQGIQKEEEMLEEVLSEVVLNFKKRNPDIQVSVTVPDTLLFVPMDAMLIEQVLFNLMDNAVSHGETTSRIWINASVGSEYATISVSDNGRGISPRCIEHLFDGSLQIHNDSMADKSRSMGIGLLVCRTIVEAHGGEISAVNLPGGGAQFKFTLKLGGTDNDSKG